MSGEISSNESDDLVKMLDRHCNELAEHFECVHIFVNRNEGDIDKTRSVNRGAGNWHARYGQIREWLIYEDERIRQCARPTEEK